MAYGSKGLLQALRELQLTDKQLDEVAAWEAWEFREKLTITDKQLDYLETALREIREVEAIDPGFVRKVGTAEEPLGEARVDLIATALERLRPGRVQEILGKTKLLYFGADRIKVLPHDMFGRPIQSAPEDLSPFMGVFFSFDSIAKSALVTHKDTDDKGCKFIWVELFGKTFGEFGADETFGDARPSMNLYDVKLFDDGTFAGYPVEKEHKTEEHKVGEKEQPKKKGFFKKLFG